MSTTAVSGARVRPRHAQAAGTRVPATRIPRRLSGPARRAAPTAVPRQSATLGARALAVVRSLPDRSLIDRMVRSRAWIPVLGVLLAGLVFMQVEILKLGTTMGHSLERTTTLQTENEALQSRVATLADDQRIEQLAAGMGMLMPAPTSLTFLSGHAGEAVGRALGNLRAPDPAGFAAQLAAQAAAAAALAPPATASQNSASTSPGATAGTQSAGGGTSTSTLTTSGTATSGSVGLGTSTATPVTSAGTTSSPSAAGSTAGSVTGAGATPATGAAAVTGTSGSSSGTPPGASAWR